MEVGLHTHGGWAPYAWRLGSIRMEVGLHTHGGWATTPAEPGHAPDSVQPDVLFHRLNYSVDNWQSPVVQYGADRPPEKLHRVFLS